MYTQPLRRFALMHGVDIAGITRYSLANFARVAREPASVPISSHQRILNVFSTEVVTMTVPAHLC